MEYVVHSELELYIKCWFSCTGILKQLVDQWIDQDEGLAGFDDFTQKHIVPACILAPTKHTFDWTDAQTVLVSYFLYPHSPLQPNNTVSPTGTPKLSSIPLLV